MKFLKLFHVPLLSLAVRSVSAFRLRVQDFRIFLEADFWNVFPYCVFCLVRQWMHVRTWTSGVHSTSLLYLAAPCSVSWRRLGNTGYRIRLGDDLDKNSTGS